MVADDAQHRLAVLVVAGEGAELAGHLGRGGVGDAGHQRGDGGGDGAALGAIVGDARGHQAGRRYWRSRGRACGTRRRARRSGATGTAPSSPRFRARWSTAARHARSDVDVEAARPPSRNCIRFSEARLHAVSSRNMYSEHGLEARIGPDAGQVCQSLMVVWNWMPGSADSQAASPIVSHSSRALQRLGDLAGDAAGQVPVAVVLDRAQEVVGDAHRVVGVLAGDGEIGLRIPVGVVDREVDVGVALPGELDDAQDVVLRDLRLAWRP